MRERRCLNLKTLSILELVVHAICIALCAIASGLSARSIYVTEILFNDVLDFTPLVLALSSVTILLLSSSLLYTIFRRQPFLSRISVELIWSGLLWSTWFGTAGYVTWTNSCPWALFKPTEGEGMICQIHPTLAVVSFLVAILLFLQWIVLLVVGHQLHEGGQRTWNLSLKELALRAPIAESRHLQVSEEPKFEYEQPSTTATLPLALPPAYPNASISVTIPASTEHYPSPVYSLQSYSPTSLEFSGVSYPPSVHVGGGWHGLQQQHHPELPDGYEIPVPISHPDERDPLAVFESSSPTDKSPRSSINHTSTTSTDSTTDVMTHI